MCMYVITDSKGNYIRKDGNTYVSVKSEKGAMQWSEQSKANNVLLHGLNNRLRADYKVVAVKEPLEETVNMDNIMDINTDNIMDISFEGSDGDNSNVWYKERVIEVFKEVAAKRNFKIIEMEVMPDHVHLLIDCNPKFGICKCVCQLKDTSSRVLRSEFPELTTRLPSLWTRSSFISSVGATSLDAVKEYIENQERQVNVKR